MVTGNGSFMTEFILLGLTDDLYLQFLLILPFPSNVYVHCAGKMALITPIGLNSHLHTPMHFSLFNLSLIDFYSVLTSKMLFNIISKNIISYQICMTQFYFCFLFFCISECYVLTSMAYDCYVAICNPLLYNIAMSPKVWSTLIFGSYLAFFGARAHSGCMLRLAFCDANSINHYFCDILPVLQLSCTNTYVNELVVVIVGSINIIVSTVTICSSLILMNSKKRY